jgi:hypothetical protein
MKPEAAQSLDLILESAIVVYWADLMHGIETGLIHIEYGFSTSGTLDYLKVWSSVSRGHWLLACGYRMPASAFHRARVHFDNGFQSEGLAHILELVMEHQNSFVLPPNLGRQGLLQISTPTEEESAAAATSVKETFDHLSLTPAELVLA